MGSYWRGVVIGVLLLGLAGEAVAAREEAGERLLVRFRAGVDGVAMVQALEEVKPLWVQAFNGPVLHPEELQTAGELKAVHPAYRWRILAFEDGRDLAEAAELLRRAREVELVAHDPVLQPVGETTVASWERLLGSWKLRYPLQPAALQLVRPAPAEPVVIAVIDSGFDTAHPALAPYLWRNPKETFGHPGEDDDHNGKVDDLIGWDFANDDAVPEEIQHGAFAGHGTGVAALAAAVGNDRPGLPHAPGHARIMALKFYDYLPLPRGSAALNAMMYAVENGAHIINGSWGLHARTPEAHAAAAPLADLVDLADARGILVVFAAGTAPTLVGRHVDDNNSFLPAGLPAPNIINVGAVDDAGQLARFSNHGEIEVDIAARGVRVLTAAPGGGQALLDGTSFAAPQVAGAAALLWAQDPRLHRDEVKAILLASASKLAHLPGHFRSGGQLDVAAALQFTAAYFRGLRDYPPSLRLLGDGEVFDAAGFRDPGVVAMDPEDGDLSGVVRVLRHSLNNGAQEVIVYEVTDSAGHTAREMRLLHR